MMIPVGYMAKRVSIRPESIKTVGVTDIYAVSGCISDDAGDDIRHRTHG